jgi:PilZ domain
MTPEMSFECLLISRDPAVVSTIHRVLNELSISTKICFHSAHAFRALAATTGTDLIVVDLADDSFSGVLPEVWKSGPKLKPTIVGICDAGQHVRGVHVVVDKPVTAEGSAKSLKKAYTKMVADYRRHARYALMVRTTATDDCGSSIPITVMDIGLGGVGLRVQTPLQLGRVLAFHLLLPGATRSIYIQARVLWTREFGTTGCEFVRIPPVDTDTLTDWLMERLRVKRIAPASSRYLRSTPKN